MTAQSASLMVIFGATGDLAQRMLLPSLFALDADGLDQEIGLEALEVTPDPSLAAALPDLPPTLVIA